MTTTTISGLAEMAHLCQAPFGKTRPGVFRGAVRDPEQFFGEEHIQQVLASDTLRMRSGQFRDQQLIDPEQYPEQYGELGITHNRASGVSLTLRGVQRIPGPVRTACVSIAATGWPTVHAVAMETPAGVQALPVHWDVNPTLAVQTRGRKVWPVWRPVDAIATASAVIAVKKARQDWDSWFTDAELAVMARGVYDEVVLEPGDVYFVPAGWPHAPAATGGSSLHVSICPLPQAVVDEFGNEDHYLDSGVLV